MTPKTLGRISKIQLSCSFFVRVISCGLVVPVLLRWKPETTNAHEITRTKPPARPNAENTGDTKKIQIKKKTITRTGAWPHQQEIQTEPL